MIVCPCGTAWLLMTPWMSKNMINISFLVELLTLNFLGGGDPGVFQLVDCSLIPVHID